MALFAREREIWTEAGRLVQERHEAAPIFAVERAIELLAAGDVEGVATWRRILAATRELLSTAAGGQVN